MVRLLALLCQRVAPFPAPALCPKSVSDMPLATGRFYQRPQCHTLNLTLVISVFFFFFNSYFIYLFLYFWLCWVFGSCEGFL